MIERGGHGTEKARPRLLPRGRELGQGIGNPPDQGDEECSQQRERHCPVTSPESPVLRQAGANEGGAQPVKGEGRQHHPDRDHSEPG